MKRVELDFYDCSGQILHRMGNGGVLCTVVDKSGRDNIITLGWGQVGPSYEKLPILTIAITPLRFSWRFIEEVPEFVVAVPGEDLLPAADLCGTQSGRDIDKFGAAGPTRVKSVHVAAPSIAECPINIECRVYTKVPPPHMLLTPAHRKRPVEEQHTIYFAQVLGTYRYEA